MENRKLMGIVNLTDNSFFAPSRVNSDIALDVVSKVRRLIDDGADIIDIGACSTAPGNEPVSAEEEWRRFETPLGALFETFPHVTFSIDTFRPETVDRILKIRNCPENIIVNDVNASEMNEKMLRMVADNGLSYVAMDSGENPLDFFRKFSVCAAEYHIDKWMVDPGFGFGKSMKRNWEILENLGELRRFGKPVVAALSHKRMIFLPLGLTPMTCTEQSLVAEQLAFEKGADIVRTHDVASLRRICR